MHFQHLGKTSAFDFFMPNADLLESFENNAGAVVAPFLCHEFTSLCPITGQPDFARLEIVIIPDAFGIESKSLKLYLNGFRNHGAFHEKVIRDIGTTLFEKISPLFLRVWGDFHVRGGIALKPLFLQFSPHLSAEKRAEVSEKVEHYDRLRKFDF